MTIAVMEVRDQRFGPQDFWRECEVMGHPQSGLQHVAPMRGFQIWQL